MVEFLKKKHVCENEEDIAIIELYLTHLLLILQRRQWHPTPVLLPGKSMDGGAWKAAVHGVAKSWTRLSDFTFTFHFHALEKEIATHSSVLAWRIPGTGEPGGLPSMVLHRVRHNWSNLAATAGYRCSCPLPRNRYVSLRARTTSCSSLQSWVSPT